MKHRVKLVILSFVMVLSACENEPIGEMNLNENVLDEALIDLVRNITEPESENGIDCIKFNYTFVIFVFDGQKEFVDAVPIRSDLEFSTFLANLEDTQTISLNYPISGTLLNGDIIEIDSNEELKEAVDACRAEELQGECNNTLIDCVWKIGVVEGQSNDYAGAYFKLRYDGIVQFHYKEDVYFGTWITLTIGYEVFLNIDLNDDPVLEEFWNLNWLIDLRSNERIEISDGDTQVLIEKDCSIPCVESGYNVCEFEDNPGYAEFILEDYTTCIPVPSTHDVVSAVTYSFYETEEDALLGINPVSTTGYENTSNPQTIYVRIAYKESSEVLHFSQIVIEAIPCTGG